MQIKNLIAAAMGFVALGAPMMAAPLTVSNDSRGVWTLSTPRVLRPMTVTKWAYGHDPEGAYVQTSLCDRGQGLQLTLEPGSLVRFSCEGGEDLDETGLAQGLYLRDARGVRLSPGAAAAEPDLTLVDTPHIRGKVNREKVNMIAFSKPADAFRAGLPSPGGKRFRILQEYCLALPPRVEADVRAMAPAAAPAAALPAPAASASATAPAKR